MLIRTKVPLRGTLVDSELHQARITLTYLAPSEGVVVPGIVDGGSIVPSGLVSSDGIPSGSVMLPEPGLGDVDGSPPGSVILSEPGLGDVEGDSILLPGVVPSDGIPPGSVILSGPELGEVDGDSIVPPGVVPPEGAAPGWDALPVQREFMG